MLMEMMVIEHIVEMKDLQPENSLRESITFH